MRKIVDFLDAVRIYADENTKMLLESFKHDVINSIIEEWVISEEKIYDRGYTRITNENETRRFDIEGYLNIEENGNILRLKLFISCDLWERFKILCKRKNINIDIGFRLAVFRYLYKNNKE